jgi:hypothetical protein
VSAHELELKKLKVGLDKIRDEFMRIADECHTVIAMGVDPEMTRELDRLNSQRRELGAKYRRILARIQQLQELEASAA